MSGLTYYLTSTGTDLSYVFLKGTTVSKSGYALSGTRGDLSNIFASNTSSTYVSKTGYLMSNNLDISTLYEPFNVTILNPNFTSPSTSGSPYYNNSATITSWSGSTVIGYGSTNVFNKRTLPGSYTQYAILQSTNSYVSQSVQLQKLNYKLSFQIIGRNNGTANLYYFSINTTLTITIGSTTILSGYDVQYTPSWTKVDVLFTAPSTGTHSLTFTNITNPAADSSILITGIVITVA